MLFFQILHIDNSHWITVSNMPLRKERNYINIYGRFTNGHISDALVHIICPFFKCKVSDSLSFHVVKVQRQPYLYDCGVFANSYATELTYGGDPACSRI